MSVSEAQTIRVLIVEDHHMVAQALEMVLADEQDLEVVGIARSVPEALAAARAQVPDVVLMDYRLPGEDGISGAQLLMGEHEECHVVLISAVGGENLRRRAMEAGCSACLSKQQPVEEVVAAVRAASIAGRTA